MRIETFTPAPAIGADWAARDRQAALRGLHRVKVRPAAVVSSGWGTDVAGRDRRSVHAWLRGKGDLRGTSWSIYSRTFLFLVPGVDLERAMFAFHSMHHTLTLGWLGYLMSVRTMTRDIQERGVLAAVKTAATGGYSVLP